jgi:hypothetical protein
MSVLLFLALSLSCPNTEWINRSSEAWNSRDFTEYKIATKKCKIKYPNSPCVKTFVKMEPLVYRVICGEEAL